jgi:lipopolysaccharide export system permease protein
MLLPPVKTLHTYLTRQVLGSLMMTVAVFTFVLLLGNVLKEVLSLLVNQQVSLGTVIKAIGLLVPYVLVFALPMGLLTATLLTFGRFSADNELTGVRASGISLLSLITPILVLSVLLSIACAFVNLQIAPQCRIAYKQLLFKAVYANSERIDSLLPERTIIRQFQPYLMYFGRNRGGELKNVEIYELEKGATNVLSSWHAPRGKLEVDRTNRTVNMVLYDAWHVRLNEGQRTPMFAAEAPLKIELKDREEKEPGINELTFVELLEKRREFKSEGIRTTVVEVQMHSQVAFSFACIAFTLIGIPLGIRAHRRETSAGIAMALLLVVVYYSFLIIGQSLDSKPALLPWLIVWLPNFVFQIVGMILLRRVNRGV